MSQAGVIWLWTGNRRLLIRKCFVLQDSRVLGSDNSHLVDLVHRTETLWRWLALYVCVCVCFCADSLGCDHKHKKAGNWQSLMRNQSDFFAEKRKSCFSMHQVLMFHYGAEYEVYNHPRNISCASGCISLIFWWQDFTVRKNLFHSFTIAVQ